MILAQFGKSKKAMMRLTTPLIEKTKKVILAKTALQIFPIAAVPLAILLIIFNVYTSIVVYGKTTQEHEKLIKVQNQQREFQQRANAQAARKADVEAMVDIYDQFSKDAIVPFNFLTKLSQLKGPALYEAIQFAVGEEADAETKKPATTIKFSADINYPNRAPNAQIYLKEMEDFAQKFRDAFKKMKVDFSGLPGQTDFTLSVQGGPTVAGSAPKVVVPNAEKRLIIATIHGKIDEDLRKALFDMPQEEKKPVVVPIQTSPIKPMGQRP